MSVSTRVLPFLAGLFLLLGCRDFADSPTGTVLAIDDLRGTSWQLVAIDPPPPVNPFQARATAKFWSTYAAVNSFHLTGYTGCNEFFGSYNDTDGRLQISSLGATKRACTPATAGVEEALLLNLPTATSFTLEDNILVIHCADGVTFRFQHVVG